jgi:hypothetical protein
LSEMFQTDKTVGHGKISGDWGCSGSLSPCLKFMSC